MKACVGAMSVGAVVYYTWGAWTPQEARVSVQWHTIYGVHGPRMRQECGYSGMLYMGCVDPARGKSVGAVLYYTWGAWTPKSQECGYSAILYMGCVDPARGKSVGAVVYYTWRAWTAREARVSVQCYTIHGVRGLVI